VIENPRHSQSLVSLSSFPRCYQVKREFYEAAEALSKFNEFILKNDLNQAVLRLQEEILNEMKFQHVSSIREMFPQKISVLLEDLKNIHPSH
jgi:hypothetical protein